MDPRFVESGASRYVSPNAGELTSSVKSGAGKLFYARICNTTANKIYAYLFDSLTATGTLLCPPVPIAANDQFILFSYPYAFATGLTISSSTTQTGYVAGGANDLQVEALYK